MNEDVKAVLKSENIPSSWTVFRARKGRATRKGISDIIWSMLLAVIAVGSATFLSGELGTASWFIALVALVAGAFLFRSGLKKLKSAAVGAIAITEDAVVVVGGKEEQHAFNDIQKVQHKTITGEGMPRSEVELLYNDGRRFLIAESDVYGEIQGMANTIQSKVN